MKFAIRYLLSGKAWQNLYDNKVKNIYNVFFFCKKILLISCLNFVIPSSKKLIFFFENQIAFSTKQDYGKGEREAQWAHAQRTLHGLQNPEANNIFHEKNSYRELSEIAEQAKRRAEIARYDFKTRFSSSNTSRTLFLFFFLQSDKRFSNFFIIYKSSRLRELHTLKGHVESVVKLKGLDIETIQQHYTV